MNTYSIEKRFISLRVRKIFNRTSQDHCLSNEQLKHVYEMLDHIIAGSYIGDLARVVISYEFYETSCGSFHKVHMK